jgi:hypothetical protein
MLIYNQACRAMLLHLFIPKIYKVLRCALVLMKSAMGMMSHPLLPHRSNRFLKIFVIVLALSILMLRRLLLLRSSSGPPVDALASRTSSLASQEMLSQVTHKSPTNSDRAAEGTLRGHCNLPRE